MNLKRWLSKLQPRPPDSDEQELSVLLRQWQADRERERLAKARKPLDELRACPVRLTPRAQPERSGRRQPGSKPTIL